MQKLCPLTFMLKVLVVAVLGAAAIPASAHQITSATGTASCASFTVTVSGTNLLNPNSGTVNFEIDTSPNVGTFMGSLAVSANDSAGDFTTSETVTWGPFNANFSLSGTANLVVNGNVESSAAISFSPSSLSCSSTPPSCPAGASTGNSTVFANLGSAGPSDFAVLSLGGAGGMVNINLATVNGNLGAPNYDTLKESAPSVVNGELIIGSSVNVTGVVGKRGPIVTDDARLSSAVADAQSAAAFFASLSSTPAVQAQFPANGQISGSLTVTGDGSVDVVNLPGFLLNSGNLTLAGPPGTGFVINISGNFNLHSGNINVSGGVGPLDVVYNITNPNATVTTMVPTTAVGILLAPNNNINSMDSSTFTGEVIGGYKKTIVLMSGSRVTSPCPQQQ